MNICICIDAYVYVCLCCYLHLFRTHCSVSFSPCFLFLLFHSVIILNSLWMILSVCGGTLNSFLMSLLLLFLYASFLLCRGILLLHDYRTLLSLSLPYSLILLFSILFSFTFVPMLKVFFSSLDREPVSPYLSNICGAIWKEKKIKH